MSTDIDDTTLVSNSLLVTSSVFRIVSDSTSTSTVGTEPTLIKGGDTVEGGTKEVYSSPSLIMVGSEGVP